MLKSNFSNQRRIFSVASINEVIWQIVAKACKLLGICNIQTQFSSAIAEVTN